MKNLSEALSLCADLLLYPDDNIELNLKKLLNIYNSTKKVEELLNNKSLKDIQSHYINLFDSNIEKIECVPYASWWSAQRLMGKEALSIKEFYKECGFEFNHYEFKMPPDHMALEIGFLSLLLREEKIKEACLMINKHLWWLDKLYECVKNKSKLYGKILFMALKLINTVKEEEVCLKES